MTFRLHRVPSTGRTPDLYRARRSTFRRLAAVAVVGASLLGGLVASSDAAARSGQVKDKKGNVYIGQVDETSVPGKVLIISDKGAKTQISTQFVDSTKYFDTAQEEFDARLAAIPKNDLPGRVALARWALAKKETDLAARAVAEAKALDSANAEVIALDKQVAALKPATPAPATGPATQSATAPVVSHGPAKRMLTADEVQLVRQRETKPGDKTLKYQVSAELRKKAVDAGVIKIAELRGITPAEIANKILTDGTPAMQKEVKILNDPQPLAEFRAKINKPLVAGCASAACHGQAAAGGFALFADPSKEEAALANLVILQKYEKSAGGQQQLMLNRTQPEASLLLGYMLPPEVSKAPHPTVKEYKGAVRGATELNFVATQRWLAQSLKPFAPGYEDIDLTADAPKADPPKADAGGGAATPVAAKAGR